MKRWSITIVMWVMASAIAAAQDGPTGAAGGAGDEPIRHRIYLVDGSILTGQLIGGPIVVTTAYGELRIPASQVERIVPGLERRTALRERVNQLVADLGSDAYEKREQAGAALLSMGPRVLGLLRQRDGDDDIERTKRLGAVIEQLEQIEMDQADDAFDPAPQEELIDADRVAVAHFAVIGKVGRDTLTLSTDYGELTVGLGKIERLQIARPADPVTQAQVEVSGDHKAMIDHLKTGVRVNPGDRVTIRATGRITMTPWGNGAFSIPDGMPGYGWYVNQTIPMGMLVGRVGGDGQVEPIGAKHSFVADASGELELAFAIQQGHANNQFPGEYKVRIRVEPRRAP